jgi:molecular chaperone GrpE
MTDMDKQAHPPAGGTPISGDQAGSAAPANEAAQVTAPPPPATDAATSTAETEVVTLDDAATETVATPPSAEDTTAPDSGVPDPGAPDDTAAASTETSAVEPADEAATAASATDRGTDAVDESATDDGNGTGPVVVEEPVRELSFEELIVQLEAHNVGLAKERDDLRQELDNLNGKLKAMADGVNKAKRQLDLQLERQGKIAENDKRRAIKSIATGMLATADNLERAIAQDTGDVTTVIEGVRMTLAELQKFMENAGLTEINPAAGDRFDPNIHEAMGQVPDPDVPSNHILDTMTKGYQLDDQVVRPAKVCVSTGPAEPPAPNEAEAAPATTDEPGASGDQAS